MNKCGACEKSVRANVLKSCSECDSIFHYQCLRISAENFQKESKVHKDTWKCPTCKGSEKRIDNTNTPVRSAEVQNSPSSPSDHVISSLKSYIDECLESFKASLLNEVRLTLNTSNKQLLDKSSDLEKSIKHFSDQYDNLIKSINSIDLEVKSLQKQQELIKIDASTLKNQINLLEAKVDDLEHRNRVCNVEIRGVPEDTSENVAEILEKICSFLKMKYDKADIYTVFRAGRKLSPEKPRPIVVIFKNVFSRNDLIRLAKAYNRDCKDPSTRLKTDYLNLNLKSQPIYISEHLTQKMKAFLVKCKQAATQRNYKYCWCTHGKIFIKKDDNSVPIIITNEDTLLKL